MINFLAEFWPEKITSRDGCFLLISERVASDRENLSLFQSFRPLSPSFHPWPLSEGRHSFEGQLFVHSCLSLSPPSGWEPLTHQLLSTSKSRSPAYLSRTYLNIAELLIFLESGPFWRIGMSSDLGMHIWGFQSFRLCEKVVSTTADAKKNESNWASASQDYVIVSMALSRYMVGKGQYWRPTSLKFWPVVVSQVALVTKSNNPARNRLRADRIRRVVTQAAVYRSLRALRARKRKKVSKRVFLGVWKKVSKNTRKSLKISIFRPFGVFFRYFETFFGYFSRLFSRSPETPFLRLFCNFGPETPVNGSLGRNRRGQNLREPHQGENSWGEKLWLRRAPDYSSNLCPPKIWSIWLF